MEISTNIANEIGYLHEIAIAKAKESLSHAKAAGGLLIEVKSAMQLEQFEKWLDEDVKLSAQQAQRYVDVAEGKPIPIRLLSSNSDTVPHVTEAASPWESPPSFIPMIRFSYFLALDDQTWYLIEPSKCHQGFHFLSYFQKDGKPGFEYLRRPVKAKAVEVFLQKLKLQDPATADWQLKPCEGVDYAGQTVGALPPEKEWWQK
jgi:hypothetical protein